MCLSTSRPTRLSSRSDGGLVVRICLAASSSLLCLVHQAPGLLYLLPCHLVRGSVAVISGYWAVSFPGAFHLVVPWAASRNSGTSSAANAPSRFFSPRPLYSFWIVLGNRFSGRKPDLRHGRHFIPDQLTLHDTLHYFRNAIVQELSCLWPRHPVWHRC